MRLMTNWNERLSLEDSLLMEEEWPLNCMNAVWNRQMIHDLGHELNWEMCALFDLQNQVHTIFFWSLLVTMIGRQSPCCELIHHFPSVFPLHSSWRLFLMAIGSNSNHVLRLQIASSLQANGLEQTPPACELIQHIPSVSSPQDPFALGTWSWGYWF